MSISRAMMFYPVLSLLILFITLSLVLRPTYELIFDSDVNVPKGKSNKYIVYYCFVVCFSSDKKKIDFPI